MSCTRAPTLILQSLAVWSFWGSVVPSALPAHVLDPAYVRSAGGALANALGTPDGSAALHRASRCLGEQCLDGFVVSDKEAALRLAEESLPKEILSELRRGNLVEETAEVLAFFGGKTEPDKEASARIRRESLAVFQMLRRLRARFKRELKLEQTRPLDLPVELTTRLKAKPPEELEALRVRWSTELLAQGLPAGPIAAPIERRDLDGDGYAELRAVDSDLDGKHDRFEGDLDGDRIFETLFTVSGSVWSAADDPSWRSSRS